ncbi:MAG: site-specific DNA-methyltransferase [Anaerolineales bacterium]|nr:site-specific DNA-methyltransferase [Anaerolineales bacterium]
MPILNWPSKSFAEPAPAELVTDSWIGTSGVKQGSPANRLILGDNLAVMAALLPEYEGRIDLIYTDPPFFTNKAYPARVGRNEDSRQPQHWELEEGYADHWPDLDAYLDMLYPRLVLMHRLLAPSGSLYLHLDWHANAYARVLLDEIFGPERLLNEIVWAYHGPSPIRSAFNRKHDTILSYTKSRDYTFNVDAVRAPYHPNTVKTFNASPKAGFGKVPDLERGKVPEDWWYFPVVARLHNERTGYPTQKPEALLERIILASSNPGDLVADFFCGSGTTAVMAARLERRFLASDTAWQAIQTSLRRLSAQDTPAFTLEYNPHTPPPLEHQPAAERFIFEPGQGRLRISDPVLLEELEYWEADPHWQPGRPFHSLVQASRPWRKGELIDSLEIPPGTGKVAVRMIKANGERHQVVLEP